MFETNILESFENHTQLFELSSAGSKELKTPKQGAQNKYKVQRPYSTWRGKPIRKQLQQAKEE